MVIARPASAPSVEADVLGCSSVLVQFVRACSVTPRRICTSIPQARAGSVLRDVAAVSRSQQDVRLFRHRLRRRRVIANDPRPANALRFYLSSVTRTEYILGKLAIMRQSSRWFHWVTLMI